MFSPQNAPEVSIVFPPLVENNFGYYYPSTAVLSGYLSSRGIACLQSDLNEAFAVYLLKPENMEHMTAGHFGPGFMLSPEEMPVVAARLLARTAGYLIDANGKHLFRDESSDLSYLLKILVQPYRIDEPPSDLLSLPFHLQPLVAAYDSFFAQTGYAENLPPSVGTLGISVAMGPQLVPALILARHVKIKRPEVNIILGGSAISLMTETDIETTLKGNHSISALIRFDGEYPLEALIKQKKAGVWEPTGIPGVSYRSGDVVIHTPPGPGPNLGSLPFAEYEPDILAVLSEPALGIVQSRGCYWGKCVYCDYIELHKGSPLFRTRTPENFVAEMEFQAQKHRVDKFSIITEAIAPAFAAKFSELIIERGLRVKWYSFAIVDKRFSAELFKAMARAGCESLAIGAETLNDRELCLMQKAATKEDTVRFIRDAHAAGITIKINLIPNLPSTTYQEAVDSLKEIKQLQDCLNSVSVFPFEATRSSRIGREPWKYGLEVADSDSSMGQAQFKLNHLEVSDPAMTDEQRARVFAGYQEFAAQINDRRIFNTLSSALPAGAIGETSWRLADDILDITEAEIGVQCFNCLTKERFLMPEESMIVIEKIRTSQPFQRAAFIGWFPSTELGEFYFSKFLEKGMLAVDKPTLPEKHANISS